MPGHLKQHVQKLNDAVAEVMLVADSIDLRSMLGEQLGEQIAERSDG